MTAAGEVIRYHDRSIARRLGYAGVIAVVATVLPALLPILYPLRFVGALASVLVVAVALTKGLYERHGLRRLLSEPHKVLWVYPLAIRLNELVVDEVVEIATSDEELLQLWAWDRSAAIRSLMRVAPQVILGTSPSSQQRYRTALEKARGAQRHTA